MDPLFLALLLYLAAVALAMVDIFVPSGGMLLVLSLLAALAAVLFGFRSSHAIGMGVLTLVIGSIPIFVFVAIKVWPHTPLGRLIILKPPVAEPVAANQEDHLLQELVGHVMLAEAAFLPSGQVRVGYRRFNALAESGFIEAGSHVRVLAVHERNLIVRATEDPLTDLTTLLTLTTATAQQTSASDGQGLAGQDDDSYYGGSLLDRPAEELGLDSLES